MSGETALARLQQAWHQCELHRHHLQHALAQLAPDLPLTAQAAAVLTDDQVAAWDQFILRFSKWQDAMGARLFPTVLAYLGEPLEDAPMLDKLERLDRLGLAPSVGDWQRLRAARNAFAHDYPQDPAVRAAFLNQAVALVAVLEDARRRLLVRLGNVLPGHGAA